MAKSKQPAELAVPETYGNVKETFALAQMESSDFAQIVRENFGGRKLSVRDMQRVSVPTGGGTRWVVKTPEGEDETPTLDGIVVSWRIARALWAEEYGKAPAGPPCCVSDDGEEGRGVPGGHCTTIEGLPQCFFNQWGSENFRKEATALKTAMEDGNLAAVKQMTVDLSAKLSPKRQPGVSAKKWCKEMRIVLLLRPEDLMPLAVNIPTMSIKPFSNYTKMVLSPGIIIPESMGGDGRKRAQTSVMRCLTRITLEKMPAAASRPAYSEARFEALRPLARDEVALLDDKIKTLKSLFDATPTEELVDQGVVDGDDGAADDGAGFN